MATLFDDDRPLPPFRRDLELYPGPDEADGSPTFNLYDPVGVKFYKLSWAESLIHEHLKPGMTLEELHEDIETNTTLKVTKDQIKYYFMDSYQHDLLALMRPSEAQEKLYDKKKTGWFKWFLYNYLFLRIPLFNPDNFLARTLKYVSFLGSRPAVFFYLLMGIAGLITLFLHMSAFFHTFTYFFNVEGVIIYALAVSAVKIVHEFSHAYTAKNFGLYVPSMGIAFIVLWPVLYTDVTDGWKLKSRRKRLYISAAGIMAETVLAGIATICWSLTQTGMANSLFFVVASVTWVSTLIINLNPAIRYDGYYIVCDLVGIDNLQYRSFSLARWKLRKWLLGLDLPPPEEHLRPHRFWGMFWYAVYTWNYRLFLYTAIAIFVYYQFTKVLGIFLFFLEIGVFLIWPIASEIKAVYQLRSHLKLNLRLITTTTVLIVVVGWLVLPLPHQVSFVGITISGEEQTIYVPQDAVITKVNVKRGQEVKKGELLFQMASPSIDAEISKLNLDNKIIDKQIYLAGTEEEAISYLPQKKAELATNTEKLQGNLNEKEQLDIIAEVSGKMILMDDKLRRGLFLPKDFVLGKIADSSYVEVLFYIPEAQALDVSVGKRAKFVIASSEQVLEGTVIEVNPVREQTLIYPPLASTLKGPLPVEEDHRTNQLKLIDAYYTAKVQLDDPSKNDLLLGKTGEVYLQGPWRSKLVTLLTDILQIFWRQGSM